MCRQARCTTTWLQMCGKVLKYYNVLLLKKQLNKIKKLLIKKIKCYENKKLLGLPD